MPSKKIFVSSLKPGLALKEYFAVAEARQGQAKNGPFWSIRLQDSSGSISARIWSPQSQEFTEIPAESIVLVSGQVVSFRDELQIQVERLEVVEPEGEEIDFSQFMPSSLEPPEVILEKIEKLCRQELHHKPWRRFCHRVLRDQEIRSRLLHSFGGKAIHHAYRGGLLEHTLSVCRICLAIADVHPRLDREILLAAAIFHDLGKAWELTGGLSADYSHEGRLLGHIHLTLEILAPFFKSQKDLDHELVLHFKHIILSHHGEYEYGSPKRPKTAEALVLHHADNLDAKLNIFSAAFDGQEAEPGEGPVWSGFQRSMNRFLCRAVRTPSGNSQEQSKAGFQCLLPLKG